jgi:uncharacterized protein with von Willebrand factor type A (vWA) domain
MSAKDPVDELRTMLEAFLRGEDRSVNFGERIAEYLIEHFPEDPDLKELLIALSAYSPHGGDYLYDESALSSVMREALAVLRQRN